ncbi:hypothetical protein YC2023_083866 [Brassica napus]
MKRGSPVGPTEAGVYAYTKEFNLLKAVFLIIKDKYRTARFLDPTLICQS